MYLNNKTILSAVMISIISGIVGCSSPEKKYDQKSQQQEVNTHAQADSVFNSLEKVSFKKLPQAYISYTQLNDYPYIYKGKSWYVIQKTDLYKFIAGKFRIIDFLPEDKYYARQDTQYLLLDRRVIYKFIDLQNELRKQKYNPYAFLVYNGFRHPQNNNKVQGAPASRHLHGQAIDIKVKDIDQDGDKDQNDKKIVLELLENDIIGNKGGVGRYIGTMSIHFDVRGYKARWNGYNRKDGST